LKVQKKITIGAAWWYIRVQPSDKMEKLVIRDVFVIS